MPKPRPQDRHEPANEVKICGLNACLAIFARRREDIVRAYVNRTAMQKLGELLTWCAETRRAYHVVADADLEKLTKSTHHEGVCLLVRQNEMPKFRFIVERERQSPGPRCLVLLEGVSNPHNLGAIARVAAHFGIHGILVSGDAATLSAAVHRTAEGGLEHVPIIRIGDSVAAVALLREAGYESIATSSHTGEALGRATLPKKALFLLGSESDGLSDRLLEAAGLCVRIPGTGAVESLNVATATAILLAEYRRLFPLP
jgi:TrmH RNA methyltransferase